MLNTYVSLRKPYVSLRKPYVSLHNPYVSLRKAYVSLHKAYLDLKLLSKFSRDRQTDRPTRLVLEAPPRSLKKIVSQHD